VASQFFYLNSGIATFSGSHTGMNTFSIQLLDPNGKLIQSVIDEIGPYRGSQSIRVSQPGIYILNIDADSSWHLDVSQ
jgi:hypothetical protein